MRDLNVGVSAVSSSFVLIENSLIRSKRALTAKQLFFSRSFLLGIPGEETESPPIDNVKCFVLVVLTPVGLVILFFVVDLFKTWFTSSSILAKSSNLI